MTPKIDTLFAIVCCGIISQKVLKSAWMFSRVSRIVDKIKTHDITTYQFEGDWWEREETVFRCTCVPVYVCMCRYVWLNRCVGVVGNGRGYETIWGQCVIRNTAVNSDSPFFFPFFSPRSRIAHFIELFVSAIRESSTYTVLEE